METPEDLARKLMAKQRQESATEEEIRLARAEEELDLATLSPVDEAARQGLAEDRLGQDLRDETLLQRTQEELKQAANADEVDQVAREGIAEQRLTVECEKDKLLERSESELKASD